MNKILAVLFLLAAGCAAELSVDEKLDKADDLFSEHGGEPGYRAAAYDLYKEALDDAGSDKQRLRAHFGVGMIGFLDLAQGLPRLFVEDPNAPEAELPPADVLARTVDTLVHEAVDKGIVEHLAVVAAQKDFSFVFTHLVFPVTDVTLTPIDLSGEWDQAEIRVIYGFLQTVVGLEELVYSYDGVVETALKAALSGAELPPLPTNPRALPDWLASAAEAAGLKPLPWLDPKFGLLNKNHRLADAKDRLDKGLSAMHEAFLYLEAEKDLQTDDVFPNNQFVKTILMRFFPKEASLSLLGAVIKTDMLRDVFGNLHTSVIDKNKPFLVPDSLWTYIEALLGDYGGPQTPPDLKMPALRLINLFSDPIQDLKAPADGLLPAFDAKGRFVVESEQEVWTDTNNNGDAEPGEFKDKGVDGFVDVNHDNVADFAGRLGEGNAEFDFYLGLVTGPTKDLRHVNPASKANDEANGIVDPVYLFFGDASMHGVMVPIIDGTGLDLYAADLDTPYTNADLMRLVSSLAWFIDTQ